MKLFRAAGVVMSISAVSAVFGLAREVVIAAEFGTTAATDAFFFANDLVVRFPEFVIPAIAGALVPVFLRRQVSGRSDEFSETVVTAFALVLMISSILLLVGAPLIVATLGSGFSPATQEIVVKMLRLLAPAGTLLGLASILKTLLEAQGRFFVSQVLQVFLSIGIIAGVLLGASAFGIYSLPIGILAAGTVQVAWAWYWLRSSGVRYRPNLRLQDPSVRRFATLLWPGLVGSVLLWLIPVIDKVLASRLGEGAVASLSFGGRPVTVLERLAIQSLVIAGLPVFSWKVINERADRLAASVQETLSTVTFVLVPMSLVIVALRGPIMSVLFERGQFTADATASSSSVLAASAVGLPWMAIAVLASTIFRSLEDTKTPAFYGAGGNIVAKLLFSPILMVLLGVAGLALATSLTYLMSAALLLTLLHRRVLPLRLPDLIRSFGRTVTVSCAAVAPTFLLEASTTMPPLALLILGTGVAATLYMGISLALKAPEAQRLWDRVQATAGRANR